MVGAWNINVSVGALPEKVASAITEFAGSIVGAEYTPVAYLGSQEVHGINHAILAEQTLVTGKDNKNVVVIILNENDGQFTVAGIERVVEGGGAFGGADIDIKEEIPAEAQQAFDAAFGAWVGATITPFLYLGSKVTNGVEYFFAVKVSPVAPVTTGEKVAVVKVNAAEQAVKIEDLLKNSGLGYAFTW